MITVAFAKLIESEAYAGDKSVTAAAIGTIVILGIGVGTPCLCLFLFLVFLPVHKCVSDYTSI